MTRFFTLGSVRAARRARSIAAAAASTEKPSLLSRERKQPRCFRFGFRMQECAALSGGGAGDGERRCAP